MRISDGVAAPLSGGGDELAGCKGDDRLTGGKDSAYFGVYRGADRDTIRDFHADGGPGVQDYIGVSDDNDKIKDAGDGTAINFGKGDKLMLKHVGSAQIAADDFHTYNRSVPHLSGRRRRAADTGRFRRCLRIALSRVPGRVR
jgi:hypothetical protein